MVIDVVIGRIHLDCLLNVCLFTRFALSGHFMELECCNAANTAISTVGHWVRSTSAKSKG